MSAKTTLTDTQAATLRRRPVETLKAGDQVFNPSMGTMYSASPDGAITFRMGFAPIDGIIWTVKKVTDSEVVGELNGHTLTSPIPAGKKVLVLA